MAHHPKAKANAAKASATGIAIVKAAEESASTKTEKEDPPQAMLRA